nr:hypothetical protein GCM10020063_082200 [Dactylosporangium thailandense]
MVCSEWVVRSVGKIADRRDAAIDGFCECGRVVTRKTLVVVLPGIGGSVLADDRGEVVWDAGFGSIWSLLRTPGRLSLGESPRLEPVGLIRSRQLVPGWTVVHGYEGPSKRLRDLPGAIVAPGRAGEPVPDANILVGRSAARPVAPPQPNLLPSALSRPRVTQQCSAAPTAARRYQGRGRAPSNPAWAVCRHVGPV